MTATKRRKRKAPPVHRPWQATVIAVDPGKVSGWAIFRHGTYMTSGLLKRTDNVGMSEVADTAVALAKSLGVPAVLVLEYHPWAGTGNARAGLEAAREAWRIAWRQAGGHVGKVVNANVATWRGNVLGVTRGPMVLLYEREHARRLTRKADVSQDEAAAIGIGVWASRAGEVGAVLPKSARESLEG